MADGFYYQVRRKQIPRNLVLGIQITLPDDLATAATNSSVNAPIWSEIDIVMAPLIYKT